MRLVGIHFWAQEVCCLHLERPRPFYVGQVGLIPEKTVQTVAESDIEVSGFGDVEVADGYVECGRYSIHNCPIVFNRDYDISRI